MVTHERKHHEECQFCYFCEEYFVTEKSVQDHYRLYHKEFEVHDHEEINNAEG